MSKDTTTPIADARSANHTFNWYNWLSRKRESRTCDLGDHADVPDQIEPRYTSL